MSDRMEALKDRLIVPAFLVVTLPLLAYVLHMRAAVFKNMGLSPAPAGKSIVVPPHWSLRTTAFRMNDGQVLLCTYNKGGHTEHAAYDRGEGALNGTDPQGRMYAFCEAMGPKVLSR